MGAAATITPFQRGGQPAFGQQSSPSAPMRSEIVCAAGLACFLCIATVLVDNHHLVCKQNPEF